MRSTLVAFLLFGAVHSSRIARNVEAGSCPLIFAKDSSECGGRISECWSPNHLDVDCENGAGLCCFDGCVNVCGVPKVCRTVYETRFENVTKEVCNPVRQEPVCTTVVQQDCWEQCNTVDDVVPTLVEEDSCHTVLEPVCSKFDSQVCTLLPATHAPQTTCPVVHLKPESQCSNDEPSDCWSPGVLDLDCDNGAGLCCFNGCYNRCVKNCATESTEVCEPYEEEVCNDVPSNECADVPSPIQVPMKTTSCTKMESACMSMPKSVCNDALFKDCQTVEDNKCTEEGEEDCNTLVTYVQKELVFNKCNIVYNKVCNKVPKQRCRTVTKEICPECKMVTTEKCVDVPRNVCNKVTKSVDKIVPRNVCDEVCQPRNEQKCTNPEPKVVCEPVVKFNSFQVPVSKCD